MPPFSRTVALPGGNRAKCRAGGVSSPLWGEDAEWRSHGAGEGSDARGRASKSPDPLARAPPHLTDRLRRRSVCPLPPAAGEESTSRPQLSPPNPQAASEPALRRRRGSAGALCFPSPTCGERGEWMGSVARGASPLPFRERTDSRARQPLGQVRVRPGGGGSARGIAAGRRLGWVINSKPVPSPDRSAALPIGLSSPTFGERGERRGVGRAECFPSPASGERGDAPLA